MSAKQIQKDKRVAQAYSDSDGCWIQLKPGYADLLTDPLQPSFTIREDDWDKAWEILQDVKREP